MQAPVVLFSVLDWGLGHATRSIPLINALCKQGYRVVLAGEGRSGLLLRQEFPNIGYEEIKGFQVQYPSSNMTLWAIRNYPQMLLALRKEKAITAYLVEKYRPDIIISDHRYGFYHPKVTSVFIGHQLRIQAGWLSSLVFRYHTSLLKKFDKIFCPDLKELPGLSGELGHHCSVLKSFNPVFIGPLSRLSDEVTVAPEIKYDVMVMISGPEPLRSRLEEKCINQLINHEGKVILLKGTPEEKEIKRFGNITIAPNLPPREIKGLLESTPVIICRPGYSTIMDLYITGRNAILIPTQGQTEQEYLAKLHTGNGSLTAEEVSMNLPVLIKHFQPQFRETKSNDLHVFLQEICHST